MLLENRSQWRGTYRELLAQLKQNRDQDDWGGTRFPDSARTLACTIRRYAPALRMVGIEMQSLGHTRSGYGLVSTKCEPQSPRSSAIQQETVTM